MAKKKSARGGPGESISGYFKRKLAERPELLKERSNDALYEIWLADHPGQKEVPLNVKQGLSSIKGSLRKKGKKRGRKSSKTEVGGAATNGLAPKAARLPMSILEKLEISIDSCLALARSMDSEGLADVIRELRKARNVVVLKQGIAH